MSVIDARKYRASQISRAYSRRSAIYSKTIAVVEFPLNLRAIDEARIHPQERILEVAIGPGRALREIVRRVDRSNTVYGVDVSEGMLRVASRFLADEGATNICLSVGSAMSLPFRDDSFDLLYIAYMLDLIPFDDMPIVLHECKRVLKRNGRIVTLNMSKADEGRVSWRERLYSVLPPTLVLYLIGGCRPVLMEQPMREAGFGDVTRQFVAGRFPSEIVIARK